MTQYEYFKLFHAISREDYDLLTEQLQTRSFKKNDLIIVPGQTQKELYFVKSGIHINGHQLHYIEEGQGDTVFAQIVW